MALLKSFLGYFPRSAISDNHCLAQLLLFRKEDYSESFTELVILSTVFSISAIVSTFVSSVLGISLLIIWIRYMRFMGVFSFWNHCVTTTKWTSMSSNVDPLASSLVSPNMARAPLYYTTSFVEYRYWLCIRLLTQSTNLPFIYTVLIHPTFLKLSRYLVGPVPMRALMTEMEYNYYRQVPKISYLQSSELCCNTP